MATPTLPAHRHAVFHQLRVADVGRLTEDSVAITFDVPDALRDAYRFTAGQHVTIRCDLGGRGVRRNYSICSPESSGRLRIGVKRLPDGAFSGYACERLRPGDVLEVMTPTGRFGVPLDPANSRHYVAIAAGSGITPVLSLLAAILETEPGSQVTLLYGNRMTSTIMFLEELADLKDRYLGRLSVLHFLSAEPQEAELLCGRIDGARLSRLFATILPPGEVDEWFLCGPLPMVRDLQGVLAGAGVPGRRVHTELFHVGARPPRARGAPGPGGSPVGEPVATGGTAAGTASVTVRLDGRATTFALAGNAEPILDAVLRARPDAPYACKGGVCGTCRARLLDGTVSMDSSHALEQDDVARGYVLTCQSHPTSGRVLLDYDG